MLALNIFLLIVGFLLLVQGADWFVEGGSKIAKLCKISPLVIGLTIVAFGTSMPELAVSITFAIEGSTDISIGNVVGSNIVNILLILGLSSLFHLLPVQRESLKLDLPVLLLASALLVGLGRWGNAVEWWDGLILLVIFAAYMSVLLVQARKKQKAEMCSLSSSESSLSSELPSSGQSVENLEKSNDETTSEKKKSAYKVWFEKMEEKKWFLVVLLLVGLAMVIGGGKLLVDSATKIAEYFKVSERIIGLTVVAIGTSLPELVTSVVAAIKGETDIAVGNIIGSNIFNIFVVAGAASLFYPLTFTFGNMIDALVALGCAVLLFVCSLFNKHRLGKLSGIVMLLCFAGYYTYLFIS